MLKEIVKSWLETNGYDGLCDSDNECGCKLDDLMPCGEPGMNCEPGYEVEAPEGSDYDFLIAPKKASGVKK